MRILSSKRSSTSKGEFTFNIDLLQDLSVHKQNNFSNEVHRECAIIKLAIISNPLSAFFRSLNTTTSFAVVTVLLNPRKLSKRFQAETLQRGDPQQTP